ncbi:hypothetical protein IKR20_02750 [bacterium]|nr:hypothetical protein [bacterium]
MRIPDLNKQASPAFLLVLSLIFATFSAFTVWLSVSKTGHGLIPLGDSVCYLDWAQEMLSSGILESFLFHKIVDWPPLYPLSIAITAKFFGCGVLAATGYLSMLLAFCISGIAFWVFRKAFGSLFFSIFFGIFFSTNPFLHKAFCSVLSEQLFCLIIIFMFLFADDSCSNKNLKIMSFFTTLAILTRYSGVAILPAVCLWILTQPAFEMRVKIKKCFLYAIFPTVFFGLYLAKNFLVVGSFMGRRVPSSTGFYENFLAFISVCRFFFLPITQYQMFKDHGMLLLVIIAVLLAFFVLYYKKMRSFFKALWEKNSVFRYSLCLIVAYSLFMVFSSTTTEYQFLGVTRFAVPIFFPMAIVYFVFLQWTGQVFYEKKQDKIVASIILCCCLSILVLSITVLKSQLSNDFGIKPYFSSEAELVEHLNKIKPLQSR